ncbi:hypothetical protein [Amycolatopsis decaplanina]
MSTVLSGNRSGAKQSISVSPGRYGRCGRGGSLTIVRSTVLPRLCPDFPAMYPSANSAFIFSF